MASSLLPLVTLSAKDSSKENFHIKENFSFSPFFVVKKAKIAKTKESAHTFNIATKFSFYIDQVFVVQRLTLDLDRRIS